MKKFELFAIRLLVLLLSVAGAAVAQTGQSTSSSAPESVQSAQQSASPQMSPDRPALQHRNPRYQVMRDDVITISFALTPELNQAVTIQPDGYVTLPILGSMYVQGMTVPEIVEALTKAYGKVLHDPIIQVDLTDFQKPYFMVSGQVGKPGQYDLRQDITASQAIAVAGGFLPTAKTQVFVFHRISSGWVEVKKLNVKDILNGKSINEDIQVQPGDMVFVPEKFITNFRKYVPYSLGLYLSPNLAAL